MIRTNQPGFCKGKSHLSNLLEFFELVSKRIDHGKPADILYLDFHKAFDKFPHKRLLRKLYNMIREAKYCHGSETG